MKALEKSNTTLTVLQMGVGTIEQVDDGGLSAESGLVCKLKVILMWSDGSELVQEESFRGTGA